MKLRPFYGPVPVIIRTAPIAMGSQSRVTSALYHLSAFSTIIFMLFLAKQCPLHGLVALRIKNVQAQSILAQKRSVSKRASPDFGEPDLQVGSKR